MILNIVVAAHVLLFGRGNNTPTTRVAGVGVPATWIASTYQSSQLGSGAAWFMGPSDPPSEVVRNT